MKLEKIFKSRPSMTGDLMTSRKSKPRQERLDLISASIVENQVKLGEAKQGSKSELSLISKINKYGIEFIELLKEPDDFGLSETCITYLENWIKEQIYNKRKEFSNKYTEKGILCEESSIQFASEILDWGYAEKNEKLFENEFSKGTPDVLLADGITVADLKNSWDCFTFPLLDTVIPNKNYEWQLQSYMDLTGRQKAQLVYVLSDMPNELIEKESNYLISKFDDITEDQCVEIFNEVYEKRTYHGITDNFKIKVFSFDRDDNKIAQIHEKVKQCRLYIDKILSEIPE